MVTSTLDLQEDEALRSLPAPTTAHPGSAEKVAILAERWNAGLELHHPEDNQLLLSHDRRWGSRSQLVFPGDLIAALRFNRR